MGAATNGLALARISLGGREADLEPQTAAWVRRARAGDADAFEHLLRGHEQMVLRTALRLLGRREAAEDAAQETFLRLHRYLGRFDEGRELAPWLYRMVVNVCRDLERRGSPEKRAISWDSLPEKRQGEVVSGSLDPERSLVVAEQRALV
jgi:RNA polymerase sigma-70 factor (ECF subfamily)